MCPLGRLPETTLETRSSCAVLAPAPVWLRCGSCWRGSSCGSAQPSTTAASPPSRPDICVRQLARRPRTHYTRTTPDQLYAHEHDSHLFLIPLSPGPCPRAGARPARLGPVTTATANNQNWSKDNWRIVLTTATSHNRNQRKNRTGRRTTEGWF